VCWNSKYHKNRRGLQKDVLLILRGNDAGGKKIYIGNLSTRAHERDLEEVFSKYGEIDDIYIPRDKSTWLGRGFAFVTYADTNDAQDAAEAWDGRRFMSKRLAVNLARPRPAPRGASPSRVKKYVPSRDDRDSHRSRSRGRRGRDYYD